MTAKQVLVQHLQDRHPHVAVRSRDTSQLLAALHGRQHHRQSPDHFHEGVNLGPGARPDGWSTGEGAVLHNRPARPPKGS